MKGESDAAGEVVDYPFTKMHGLGNDFVVLDHFEIPETSRHISPQLARFLADRRTGVGCDQVVQILPSGPEAHAAMRIFNADGSQAEMCGNAVRCVARFLRAHHHLSPTELRVGTLAGVIKVRPAAGGLWAVDMGTPEVSRLRSLSVEGTDYPFTAVSMGNPHCVIIRSDAEDFPLERIGPQVEHHPLFPNRTNVALVMVLDRRHLRMRVWERGVGITPACGTGACAATVAAASANQADRAVAVQLDGGILDIQWQANGHVVMTGPATEVFSGVTTFKKE